MYLFCRFNKLFHSESINLIHSIECRACGKKNIYSIKTKLGGGTINQKSAYHYIWKGNVETIS